MKLAKLKQLIKEEIKKEMQNVLQEESPPLTSKEIDLIVKALGEMPPYECQKYDEIKPPNATGLSPEFWPRPKEWPETKAGQENPWPPADAYKCTEWLFSWARKKRRGIAQSTRKARRPIESK